MTTQNIFDIAKAVVAELNAAPDGTFSQAFTAVFKLVPKHEISELSNLKVTVVPQGYDMKNSSRAATEYDFTIDIGIQKKLTTADVEAECCGLYPVVDEIIDYLQKRCLTAVPWANQTTMSNAPVVSVDHLDDNRVFSSLVTIGYKAMAL